MAYTQTHTNIQYFILPSGKLKRKTLKYKSNQADCVATGAVPTIIHTHTHMHTHIQIHTHTHTHTHTLKPLIYVHSDYHL